MDKQDLEKLVEDAIAELNNIVNHVLTAKDVKRVAGILREIERIALAERVKDLFDEEV